MEQAITSAFAWLRRLLAGAYRLFQGLNPAAWLIIACCLLAAALFGIHRISPYSSDDVFVQTILFDWTHGLHTLTWINMDCFVLKLPIYLATQLILPLGRRALFLDALFFSLANLILFWFGARYFIRRFASGSDSMLGLLMVWVVLLGFFFTTLLTRLNTRNIEIGASFALLALAARYLENGPTKITRKYLVNLISICAALGLFLLNDQYFIYNLVLPLAILLLVSLRKTMSRRRVTLLGVLILGVGFFKIWALAATVLNIKFYHQPVAYATVDKIGGNIRLFVDATTSIFHAHLFGMTPGAPLALLALINLAVLSIVFRYIWIKGLNIATPQDFWRTFFILQLLLACMVFIFSDVALDILSARYLAILPFDVAILGAWAFSSMTDGSRKVMAIITAVALLGNIAFLGARLIRTAPNPNYENMTIISQARSLGLTKGYADYWDASINTYLAGGAPNVIAVDCPHGESVVFHWLMDDGPSLKPAKTSFYIYDKDRGAYGSCDDKVAARQFGPATKTVPISATATMYVYDYDITTKLK
jgi:hypothetical protein